MTKNFTGIYTVKAFFVSCFVLIVIFILSSTVHLEISPAHASAQTLYSEEDIESEPQAQGLESTLTQEEKSILTDGAVQEKISLVTEEKSPASAMIHLVQAQPELDIPLVIPPEEPVLYPIGVSLTPTEVQMLKFMIQTEAGSKSLEHKIALAELVLNRVNSHRFPNTVDAVLNSPGQFNTMGRFDGAGDFAANQTTEEAVGLVLSGKAPDYAKGALFFCNPTYAYGMDWFENCLTFLFELEGHNFYC